MNRWLSGWMYVYVQALTRSDSDSSSILGPDGPAPILYRLRADGRKVPITDGQGMDLARRKGLIQEVVSPKRASKTLADANSAFGAQLSQPETVVLHSVELPQVQLGDREIADSPPEKAGDEAAPQISGDPPELLDLRSHPSLLQLQQQQQQPQTNTLMTECGLEPRSNSETVRPSSRGSPELAGISQSMSMSRIGSMNRLAAEVATAGEMAGNRLGSAAPSMVAASQQPGYMRYWGSTNNSAPLPHQAMPLGVTSTNPSLETSGYVGASAVGTPFAHSLQRESLTQVSHSAIMHGVADACSSFPEKSESQTCHALQHSLLFFFCTFSWWFSCLLWFASLDRKSSIINSVYQTQLAGKMQTLCQSHAATAVAWHHDGIRILEVCLLYFAAPSKSKSEFWRQTTRTCTCCFSRRFSGWQEAPWQQHAWGSLWRPDAPFRREPVSRQRDCGRTGYWCLQCCLCAHRQGIWQCSRASSPQCPAKCSWPC